MNNPLWIMLLAIVSLSLWAGKSYADDHGKLLMHDSSETNSTLPSSSTETNRKKDLAPSEKHPEHKENPTLVHLPPHPVTKQATPAPTQGKDHDRSKDTKNRDRNKDKEKQHRDDHDKTVVYYNYVSYAPYIGEILPMLPWDAEEVEINNQTYYTSDGVYYIDNPQGYQIVSEPIASDGGDDADTTFTVNIPDGNGGWVPVVIKRSGTGSGFVGPQNEYYEDFPTIEQLQETYL